MGPDGSRRAPRRREETRARIVAAAERVMRGKGISHATTREIAQTAGVAEGSIYNHFRSKADLFYAVLGQLPPDFFALTTGLPARAGTGDVRETLEEVVRAAVIFYGHSVPIGISVAGDPPLLARLREEVRRPGAGPQMPFELLGDYLRAEQELGRLSDAVSPRAAADLLMGTCFQKAYLAHFYDEAIPEAEVAAFARRAVNALLHGLAPPN